MASVGHGNIVAAIHNKGRLVKSGYVSSLVRWRHSVGFMIVPFLLPCFCFNYAIIMWREIPRSVRQSMCLMQQSMRPPGYAYPAGMQGQPRPHMGMGQGNMGMAQGPMSPVMSGAGTMQAPQVRSYLLRQHFRLIVSYPAPHVLCDT